MIQTQQQPRLWSQRPHEDAETDRLIEKEIETEICQRFIRLSCEKMLNARHERGGAKLHRNLLILHLLRKARTDSKRLPYECASLLKRPPMSTSSAITRHLSAGAVSPPQENVFLSEAEVEHDAEEEIEAENQQDMVVQEMVVVESQNEEDVEIDVVNCDEEPKVETKMEEGTLRSVPSTYSLLDISKNVSTYEEKQQYQKIVVVGGPLEYKVRDQDEREQQRRGLFIGHVTDSVRFEPLHLPFTSSDAIEEATDVASLLDESEQAKVPELSDDLDQQLQMISPPISPPEAHTFVSGNHGSKFFGNVVAPLDFEDDDDQPPQLFVCTESDDEDSGTEEDDEDCVDGQQTKRRKRKTSTPRQTAEKRQCCTVDADSDSGVDVDAELTGGCDETLPQKSTNTECSLISVYSTGLGTTIVPQASSPDQTVPVILSKRIHSSALF